MPSIFRLFLLLLLFLPRGIVPFEPPPSQHFSLNLAALDGFWHRAAVMALLKLKAESLFASLPPEERTIFIGCSKGAKRATEMAKCVSALMKERDRRMKEEEGRRRIKRKDLEEEKASNSSGWSMLEEGILGMKEEEEEEEEVDGRGREWEEREQLINEEEGEDEEEMALMVKLNGINLQFGILPGGREKRDTTEQNQLIHLENLRELQRFLEIREFCKKYLAQAAHKNAELLRSHLPFSLRLRLNEEASRRGTPGGMDRLDQIGQILSDLTNESTGLSPPFLPHSQRLSLFSPRLFPILPGHSVGTSAAGPFGWLLSPRMFSLTSSNDGLFPLAGQNGHLVNRLLAISGAGKAIQQILDGFGEEKQRIEEVVFPAVLEMQRKERKWRQMMDKRQRRELQEFGFAFLRREQGELIYGKEKADALFEPEMSASSQSQRHHRLERAIHALAQMDENPTIELKGKEQNQTGEKQTAKEVPPAADADEHPGLKILAPFAFANFVAEGVALEALILSPHAFVSEVLSPVALTAEVLSPRAFVAAILTPNALFARILSPGAFRAEVLSPRALTPFVLSPEAMIAEVLSPRALEPRVLSPEVGIIKVLSPVFLSPRVLSPEQLAVIVLSPTILSPGVLSHEKLVVEIISPHILSGGSEEEEHQGHEHGHGGEHEHGHGVAGDGHEGHGTMGGEENEERLGNIEHLHGMTNGHVPTNDERII